MNATLNNNEAINIPNNALPPMPELSQLVIHLYKGVLYRAEDERLWASLLRRHAQVREHVGVPLLDLVVDEAEGYAYLKSRAEQEESDGAPRMPRLVARRALPYRVCLLLALLRKRLAEFDAGSGDPRLVLSRDEIVEIVQVFLPDGTNQTKIIDQLDTTITKVVELGFLSPLKSVRGGSNEKGKYEVRRILKAYVDAQWLAEFDSKLELYRKYGAGEPTEQTETKATMEGDSDAS